MAEHSPAIKLRLAQDHERQRLSELDRQDCGDRCFRWTLATFYGLPQLELGTQKLAYFKFAKLDEGKWDMAKRGSKTKSTVAAELIEALSFVGQVANKEEQPWQPHVVLHNSYAIAGNGQIFIGHPIAEDLIACPHLGRFKAAINKCGSSLNIVQLDSGKLSVKGDRLTAQVECLPLENYPYTQPDPMIAVIDDRLKLAFATCGICVDEDGARMIDCSILLEANQCTATNGKMLIQYWHGIDLPPNLIVPKTFANIVGRAKHKLMGFGWSQGKSITFHFENGAWVKTQLYEDEYPTEAISRILAVQTNPKPVPEGFFEGVAAVAEFNPDGVATLKANKIVSHLNEAVGAQYVVEGVNSELSLNSENCKDIAGIATELDLTSFPDRAFFYGENMRGVTMAIRLNKEPVGEQVREPEQAYRDSQPPYAYSQKDDDIPF